MKASSESGECASLISTVSFSVFEAVCWPGMGVSVSFSGATPQSQVVSYATSERPPRPGFGSSQRDFPVNEWSIGDGRKGARRRGLLGAGPGDFLQREA